VKVTGGLKLKRELVTPQPQAPTDILPVAEIWVDAGVYHLDSPFSYLVPQNLADEVQIGSLVSVPFHGREVIGLVINRVIDDGSSGLKSITKVLGKFPVLTKPLIELIAQASRRYAAHPFDLLRSAIPDRVATVEKEFTSIQLIHNEKSAKAEHLYLQLPPVQIRTELLAKKIAIDSTKGGVLVVLPDAREVDSLAKAFEKSGLKFATLGSELSKSENYRSFLSILTGQVQIAIGTRSAIFAPVRDLNTIIIYNEGSEHFYERRSPGWNVRDMALLRSRIENVSLIFAGYSPSAETARLIDEGWIDYKRSRGKVKVSTFSQSHGELLPSRAIAPIKKALNEGPVLFLVPLKGYAQAIRCSHCKTISRCECGGAHEQKGANSGITCNHCAKKVESWKCVWCHQARPALVSRGIERHLHEIGLLFPGIPAVFSSADHAIAFAPEKGIVLATAHMAPKADAGYSAVVILEGNRFLSQPDLRANERSREMYFAHAALVKNNGNMILIQDEGDSISTALATWNPSPSVHRDLGERKELHLPPYVRAIKLIMSEDEVTRLKKALEAAKAERRLPVSSRILGPIPEADKASLILTADVEDGEELIVTIHEFMRRRSITKKPLPSLRIDPYSLSR
jgi:primosomal protein N' (replication factor Y)